MGISQAVDTTDFHVEAIDLLTNRTPCDAGVGLLVAVYSELKKQSVLPALLLLGDLSIQGNIKPLRSLAEALQVGMDNGARRARNPDQAKQGCPQIHDASSVASEPDSSSLPGHWISTT